MGSWVPDVSTPIVPPVILDAVVAVPTTSDGDTVISSGPGEATAAGEQDRLDADVEAAKQTRYISAFELQVTDLNEQDNATTEVVSLLQQLEDLDNAAQRSVAAEVESAVVLA